MGRNNDPRLPELCQQAWEALQQAGGNQTAAAAQLGISRGTLQARVARHRRIHPATPVPAPTVDQQAEANAWKRKHDEARRQAADAVAAVARLKARLAEVLELKESVLAAEVAPVAPLTAQGSGESTAVAVWSDWHLEEPIAPEQVAGLNRHDLTIGAARATRLVQKTLSLVEMCRGRGAVPTLVVGLLGDFISGYIHEDLQESCLLSPTEALLESFRRLKANLEFLRDEGGFKRIVVVGAYDNHGRTTEKRRVATAAENSYTWLGYQFLRMALADCPGKTRLEWQIAEGYHSYLSVYNEILRFHHGDAVRYHGGIGGVHIPLNKAIAGWNKARRASIDVLGHFHTLSWGQNYVTNGSLIGYGPFSVEIKADYEPPQQALFLVHPEYGKTLQMPVYVEDKRLAEGAP